ncbi:hypothetical protein [Dokdonella sp.]|uniref:hypothetical protein n=1 Tax=Dokdonella sp. TaxID=2291710 RepID=UPI0031C9C60B|nr:hypothetical protein [Dokdonella sp.]
MTPRSILAGALLSVFSISAATAAPSLTVNQDNIALQAPVGKPALRYQADGPSSARLTAYTDGYLLCANVGSPVASSIVHLVPRHETANQHQWTFPSAVDAFPVTYRGETFTINRQPAGLRASTLTCNPLGPQGEWTSPFMDSIFADGFWNGTEAVANNYRNMLNWNPPSGSLMPPYDWSNPLWGQLPQDPCVLGGNDAGSMRVDESVACGAATGIVPAGIAGATRGPIMWIESLPVGVALKLTYVFRVDASVGTQVNRPSNFFELPQQLGDNVAGLQNFTMFAVRDAFDETLLSSAGDWCTLAQLPSTLDANVCNGAIYSGTLSSASPFVDIDFVLGTTPDGGGSTHASFYVAVTRTVVGGQTQPAPNTPIVAASVFVEPTVVAEGGNRFRGDDVIFGFVPGSPGFPWMKGGPANP